MSKLNVIERNLREADEEQGLSWIASEQERRELLARAEAKLRSEREASAAADRVA